MKLFYISPHFDDVIASCGGKIYQDYLNEDDVTIITIFSKAKTPYSNYAKSLHKYWNLKDPINDRTIENNTACQILNAKTINLNYLDAIYRTNNNIYLYQEDGDIFKDINKYDYNLKELIEGDILKVIEEDCILYFPLGIGNHIDHTISHQVGLSLKNKGYRVIFYKDFSYVGKLSKECQKLKKIEFIMDNDILSKKCESVSKYRSQINMLFGGQDKIKEYYEEKLNRKEEYYE